MVDQSASAEDGAEQELLEHVRAKYREERDKRLAAQRPGGAALTGDLARYLDDPYTSAASRDSVSDEVDAVVVGAGFGGLVVGARLREAGLERIRLIDTAGDVGGVWYWNRYPGAMCDVESYIYLPLLEEVGTIPEWKYANAPVILDHARVIAKHYGLYDLSLFHTAVTSATWDDAASRWRLRTDRGDWITARLVVFGIGSLAHPRLPAIPGVGEFGGPSFHTSRWDYTVTGGQ
jgi:cyclohexanone monooxygenase